jgi:hypothetical protein
VAGDPPAADKRGSRPDEPGATFISQTQGVRLSLYKPATELPASALEGRLMRLPLYRGKPAFLAVGNQAYPMRSLQISD